MDTARQVIRWALPGWVAIIFWIGFIGVNWLIHGPNQPMYFEILNRLGPLILPLGVAAVPVGFIIYQIYYWTYWYIPVPSVAGRRFLNPVDRGREILSTIEGKVDFGPIFYKEINNTPVTPFKEWGPILYKSAEVMGQYRENWHLSDSAWYLALADNRYKNVVEYLEKRNQFLGDIYHSLGASYISICLAYLVYMVTLAYITYLEFGLSLSGLTLQAGLIRLTSFFINTLGSWLMVRAIRGGRMSSFDALFALKHDVITHVMLNKSAYTDGFRYDAANRAVKRIALTRRQRRRSGRKNHIG